VDAERLSASSFFGLGPADIRAWIEAKGGAEKMPQWTFWTLGAEELWKMGYRKCPD
jgi:hypothetical protein